MIETVKPEETFSDKLDQDLGSEPEYEIVVSSIYFFLGWEGTTHITRVGLSISADIGRSISADIGRTDISVSVVVIVLIISANKSYF